MKQILKKIAPALIIALGLLGVGYGIKSGLKSFSEGNRQVSVRGLAERYVDADRVTWPLVYTLVGNDLQSLYAGIGRDNDVIKSYLLKAGIEESEITVVAPEVTDRYANLYGSDRPANRYVAKSVVVVSSDKVKLINELIANSAQLLNDGIALDTNDYSNPTTYEFTGLNDIKPEMIAEATKSAREAADKFAADSHSKIGKIITASQGSFSIENRDSYTPYIKYVRVVTTITYSLNN